jgi:anti-sigma factor RsiW
VACNEWRDKLDRYIDGELTAEEASAFGAHLGGCPGCAAESVQRLQMKRSVQLAGKRFEPTSDFRNRIAKRVEKKSRSGIAAKWKFALIPAFAVLAAAFLLTSYFGRERSEQRRVFSELADLHVATLASSTQVDVLSTDRHTVKPWFQGKIPFTFNLPDLPGSEFTLVGGRIAYLEQVSGAHLIYQIRKHEISVFIFPDREGALQSLPSEPVNAASFNLQTWTKNGLRYFVIGDANRDDIAALSKLLRDTG